MREEKKRNRVELMVKPRGETDEKTDGSPKIPARFDFFFFFFSPQCYIVVIVESYKL